jgi:hypothetical protein
MLPLPEVWPTAGTAEETKRRAAAAHASRPLQVEGGFMDNWLLKKHRH